MAKALAEPKKPGYEFAGWYDAPGDTGTRFEPAANATADGSVNKLYAHWTPAVYTVSFDANGGETVTTTKKVTFDSTYPKDLPTPASRTGYTFAGWFPAKDGGTKVEGGTTKVTATSDHTLYAHWDPLELTLNFNYNFPGGITQDTSTHPNITPTKAKYGQPYGTALPARNPASVTSDEKVTYTFDGWYTTAEDKNGNPDGTGGVTGQKVQSSLPVELEYSGTSATLYARWKYKVSFYANLNPAASAWTRSPAAGTASSPDSPAAIPPNTSWGGSQSPPAALRSRTPLLPTEPPPSSTPTGAIPAHAPSPSTATATLSRRVIPPLR